MGNLNFSTPKTATDWLPSWSDPCGRLAYTVDGDARAVSERRFSNEEQLEQRERARVQRGLRGVGSQTPGVKLPPTSAKNISRPPSVRAHAEVPAKRAPFTLKTSQKLTRKKTEIPVFKYLIQVPAQAENPSPSARLGEILSCVPAVQRFY